MVLRTRLHSSALPCMNTLAQNMKVKCKKTAMCTSLPKTGLRTKICICMCAPGRESLHMKRGTGGLGDVSKCPHKHKKRLSRRLSHQRAALLEISAPCTYSPGYYVESKCFGQNIQFFIHFDTLHNVYTDTDVIKFSVWTAAWARLCSGGATASVWSFLMSRHSDVS